MSQIIIHPAYGIKYENCKDVLKAWRGGCDFYSDEGYTSVRDKINRLDTIIFIQYNPNLQVTIHQGIL